MHAIIGQNITSHITMVEMDRGAVRVCIRLLGAPGGRALSRNPLSFQRRREAGNKRVDQLHITVRAGQTTGRLCEGEGRGPGSRGRNGESRVPPYRRLSAVLPQKEHAVVSRATRALKALGIEPTTYSRTGSRCELARQARHTHRHHRFGTGRDPYDQGICEPRGIREGLPPRHPHGHAGRLAATCGPGAAGEEP